MKKTYPKRKPFFFLQYLLLLILLPGSSSILMAQTTVLIGNGTATQTHPLGNSIDWERSAALYLSSEIAASGFIDSVAWNTAATDDPHSMKIYFLLTADTSLSSLPFKDYTTHAQLVYEGQLNASTGWKSFPVDPFFYNGVDHLIVLVENNYEYNTSGTASSEVYYTSGQVDKHSFWEGSYSPPLGNGTISSDRPNVRLSFNSVPACSGAPSAGTLLSTLNICGGEPIYLKAENASIYESGLSGQWQFRNPSGSGLWENVSGSLSGPQTMTTALSTPTDYRYILTCGANSDTSNIMTTATLCYCTAQGSLSNRYINNFTTFGGSENIKNMNSRYSPDGYGLFNNMAVIQDRGAAVTFQVSHAGMGYGFKIWVDWNQDGYFDQNEEVYFSTATSAGHAGGFTVPDTALLGKTRMRIGNDFVRKTGPLGPCGTLYDGGEYEDYTFEVTDPTCRAPKELSVSSIGSTSATLSWQVLSPAPANGYEYYLSTSSNAPSLDTAATGSVSTGVLSKTFSSLLPDTEYYVWLRSVCAVNDKSGWALNQRFKTFCMAEIAPWTYDVESQYGYNYDNVINDCWLSQPNYAYQTFAWTTNSEGSGFYAPYAGPSQARSGSKFFYIYARNGQLGEEAELRSPLVNVDNLITPALEFYYHMFGTQTGNLFVEAFDGTTWNLVDSLKGSQQTASDDPWRRRVISLSGYTGDILVRFKGIRGSNQYGDISIDDIKIKEMPVACSGKPSVSLATGPASLCSGEEFELIGIEQDDLGISYQWQKLSPLGLIWEDIQDAESFTYTEEDGILIDSDYRLIVTCSNSNESDTSGVIHVDLKSVLDCYCEPNHDVGCDGGHNIQDVVLVGDIYPGIQNRNTSCSPNGYDDYTLLSATVTAGNAYTGFVTTSNLYADENVRIWIDYNLNGQFEDEETVGLIEDLSFDSLGNFTFTVPDTISSGSYRMRVRLLPYYDPLDIEPCFDDYSGETHDYTINVLSRPLCVGKPDAGLISGPGSICPEKEFELIADFSPQGNMAYQWQQLPLGAANWEDIPNEIGLSYWNRIGLQTTSDFRLIATCLNGNEKDTSNVLPLALKTTGCPCIPKYEYGCEYGAEIRDVILQGEQAAGIENLNTSCAAKGYSDYLHLSTTLKAGNTYTGYVTTDSWDVSVRIWIDYNQNGDFESGEIIATMADLDDLSTGEFTFTLPNLTLPGDYVMRVRLVYAEDADSIAPCILYDEGEAHDYTIIVQPDPLPITLKTLQAENQGKINIISWETLREEHGDQFVVQRSTNGRNFKMIASLKGKGAPSKYNFPDEQPIKGINFYRLGLLNNDGSLKYSKIVEAKVKEVGFSVRAYPNPTNEMITLKINGIPGPTASLTISDPAGRVIRVLPVAQNKMNVNMAGFSSGLYILKYSDEEQTVLLKVTKK